MSDQLKFPTQAQRRSSRLERLLSLFRTRSHSRLSSMMSNSTCIAGRSMSLPLTGLSSYIARSTSGITSLS